jgi:ankyrin repeat protein
MRITIIRFLEIIWVIFLTTFIFVSVLFALWHRAAYHGEKVTFSPSFLRKQEFTWKHLAKDHESLEIFKAISKNDISRLRHFPDVNIKGDQGMTPLLWSLYEKNQRAFTILLEKGADSSASIDRNWNFFQYERAMNRGGVNVPLDGFSVTSLAAGFYEPKYLNLILEHHGNPNSINPVTKLTPLFDLVTVTFVEETDDQVENFKALIKAGADIEYRLPRQDNLLFYTITQHYPRYILALLESGADFRALNNRGEDCVMLLYPELETDPRYGDIKKWMERVGFDFEAARKAAPTWTKPMTLPVEERPWLPKRPVEE